MAKSPFHAKAHAAMKAAAKRVDPNIFKRVEPKVVIPGALDYPRRAMKSSDFTAYVSLPERLDEIAPSAHGKITAPARDKLRRKHGLPT